MASTEPTSANNDDPTANPPPRQRSGRIVRTDLYPQYRPGIDEYSVVPDERAAAAPRRRGTKRNTWEISIARSLE